ncbi:rCG55094 [Rattus norvegicus]|uniref:RCG55094 n=1 Tax=Rattus norvegicus TaxID=10116 RepID=A6IIZ2_RAT|nr:rCG55094 [Rattus norvegicus]
MFCISMAPCIYKEFCNHLLMLPLHSLVTQQHDYMLVSVIWKELSCCSVCPDRGIRKLIATSLLTVYFENLNDKNSSVAFRDLEHSNS